MRKKGNYLNRQNLLRNASTPAKEAAKLNVSKATQATVTSNNVSDSEGSEDSDRVEALPETSALLSLYNNELRFIKLVGPKSLGSTSFDHFETLYGAIIKHVLEAQYRTVLSFVVAGICLVHFPQNARDMFISVKRL